MLARSSFVPPHDLEPYVTADGSVSLRSAALQEGYHSVHGALQESRHVFIQHGLCAVDADPLRILEVGLGTGLNLLLTLADPAVQGRSVGYVALEPFPPPVALVQALDHPTAVGRPDLRVVFDQLMDPAAGDRHEPRPGFTVERRASDVLDLRDQDLFHLVYFDAFGPRTQPGMWTAEVFGVIHRAMAPGGVLVTYCAKGDVRRTLQGCGFRVERLQGPPGKREMLRARKPLA
jgi:tRNA U34 5-methylaminomethyl-2-thiouridine-forming methyltransferase MnmC